MRMAPFPEDPFESDSAPLQIFNMSDFKLPVSENRLHELVEEIEQNESISFKLIEVVYVDESEIASINKKHLDHDYITDIITFRYDAEQNQEAIEGTLYCCSSRIAEQAAEYATDLDQEFYRIFIHGLLHLAGYNDKSVAEKKKMTKLEDYYLSCLTQ